MGIFDVRYDPGVGLALVGALLLSASLVPLLWPSRRHRPLPSAPRAANPHADDIA